MVNLRATSGWDLLASLRHPCKFQWVSHLGSVTARHSSSGRQPNFVALNRGRHLYSAGRPSRWALAHISSIIMNSSSNYSSSNQCPNNQMSLKLQHNSQPAGDMVDCAAGYLRRQITASGSRLNSKLSPTQRAKVLGIQLTVLIIAVKFNKSRFPRLLIDLNCSALFYFKGSQPASSELKIKCCE